METISRVRDGEAGRVLIADDDVDLTAEGLHVLESEEGLDALERACRERPDLVLTDVKMPGLDGFQLAERLRRDERTRRIPLIFPSGEVARANAERARALVAARAGSAQLPAAVASQLWRIRR